MVYVKCPLKHDVIIDLLENYDDTDIRFKFVSKTGITLTFEVNTKNTDIAAKIAEDLIGEDPFFLVVKYQVSY